MIWKFIDFFVLFVLRFHLLTMKNDHKWQRLVKSFCVFVIFIGVNQFPYNKFPTIFKNNISFYKLINLSMFHWLCKFLIIYFNESIIPMPPHANENHSSFVSEKNRSIRNSCFWLNSFFTNKWWTCLRRNINIIGKKLEKYDLEVRVRTICAAPLLCPVERQCFLILFILSFYPTSLIFS